MLGVTIGTVSASVGLILNGEAHYVFHFVSFQSFCIVSYHMYRIPGRICLSPHERMDLGHLLLKLKHFRPATRTNFRRRGCPTLSYIRAQNLLLRANRDCGMYRLAAWQVHIGRQRWGLDIGITAHIAFTWCCTDVKIVLQVCRIKGASPPAQSDATLSRESIENRIEQSFGTVLAQVSTAASSQGTLK